MLQHGFVSIQVHPTERKVINKGEGRKKKKEEKKGKGEKWFSREEERGEQKNSWFELLYPFFSCSRISKRHMGRILDLSPLSVRLSG